ncbi:capsid staple protein [Morganella morganii]|uniref:capsid staple protein n=1 Tax=Morganella morganii TaxID=582 RepID=UPI003EB8A8C1
MKMINLKTSTETYENASGKKETRDEYPYGLRISLENDTIEKLGTAVPDVGESIELHGVAKILSKSVNEREGKKSVYVELQITDMALGSGSEKTATDVLFDGGE